MAGTIDVPFFPVSSLYDQTPTIHHCMELFSHMQSSKPCWLMILLIAQYPRDYHHLTGNPVQQNNQQHDVLRCFAHVLPFVERRACPS